MPLMSSTYSLSADTQNPTNRQNQEPRRATHVEKKKGTTREIDWQLPIEDVEFAILRERKRTGVKTVRERNKTMRILSHLRTIFIKEPIFLGFLPSSLSPLPKRSHFWEYFCFCFSFFFFSGCLGLAD